MKEIPINTRAVGEPAGSYILYLEDYVHTFIKRALQEGMPYGELPLTLYGYTFDENGRHYLVVAGAIDRTEHQVSGERFFPHCTAIGEAIVREGDATQLAFTIVMTNGRSLSLNDFYIYYDRNEEMQNYLVEWNLSHNRRRLRGEGEPAMQMTRIAQSYHREEARVSSLWKAVNLLSLGLMVCIMAFAVVSVNNYHKMKSMETKLTVLMESTTDALATIADIPVEEETAWVADTLPDESEPPSESVPEPESMSVAESAVTSESTDVSESVSVSASAAVTEDISQIDPSGQTAESPTTYYIVQRGDTLRSISYAVYGDYEHVPHICVWNQIVNPDSIFYGQTLLLQAD